MNDYDQGYRDGWNSCKDYSSEASTIGNAEQWEMVPLSLGVVGAIYGISGIIRRFELNLQVTSSIILPIVILVVSMVVIVLMLRRSRKLIIAEREQLDSKWRDRLPKK